MNNETKNQTASGASSSLERIISRHCAHIRKPYTLAEICEQVETGEYNAELMLQHLLIWVSANADVDASADEKPPTKKSNG